MVEKITYRKAVKVVAKKLPLEWDVVNVVAKMFDKKTGDVATDIVLEREKLGKVS